MIATTDISQLYDRHLSYNKDFGDSLNIKSHADGRIHRHCHCNGNERVCCIVRTPPSDSTLSLSARSKVQLGLIHSGRQK